MYEQLETALNDGYRFLISGENNRLRRGQLFRSCQPTKQEPTKLYVDEITGRLGNVLMPRTDLALAELGKVYFGLNKDAEFNMGFPQSDNNIVDTLVLLNHRLHGCLNENGLYQLTLSNGPSYMLSDEGRDIEESLFNLEKRVKQTFDNDRFTLSQIQRAHNWQEDLTKPYQ